MASEDNFLSRWSRRKVEARSDAPAAEPAPPDVKAAPVQPAEDSSSASEKPPLPAVESLTPESDFAPFMDPEVDGGVRRQALKTLFSDPRFNVMDMMDVYVDDYSKPDPLPESWLAKMESVSWLGDKGGRDREEAERRRALAKEVAEAGEAGEATATKVPEVATAPAPDCPDASQAVASAPPGQAGAAKPAGAPHPDDGINPLPVVRESAP